MSSGLQYALANPILNAYMTGVQQRRQAEQQQFEQEYKTQQAQTQQDQFASQQDLMKQQLAIYKQHADAELAQQQASLKEEHSRNWLEANKNYAAQVASGQMQLPQTQQQAPQGQPSATPMQSQMAQTLARPAAPQAVSGPQVANPNAQATPQQVSPPPVNPVVNYGGYDINTTGMATPQDLMDRRKALNDEEARAAGAKSKAEAEGKAPTELAQLQAQLSAQAKNAQDLEEQRSRHEMDRTRLTAQNAKDVEAMRARAELDRTRIATFGDMDPEQFSGILGQVTNGQSKLPSGPLGKMIQLHAAASGDAVVDPKIVEDLNAMHSLDQLRGVGQKYADVYAPGGAAGTLGNKLMTLAPGDLKAQQQLTDSLSSTAAKPLGGVSRTSAQEIQRIAGQIPSSSNSDTKETSATKMKNFDEQYSAVVKRIVSGLPKKTQDRLLSNNGFNLDGTTTNKPDSLPKGNGRPIDQVTMSKFYVAAGNDPSRAAQMAKDAGWAPPQ